MAAFFELKWKVDKVKELIPQKAREKTKIKLPNTDEENIFKASKKLDTRAKDYSNHIQLDAKAAGSSVQDDENGMRNDFNAWAPKLNKIFETFAIGKVIVTIGYIWYYTY